MNPAPLYLIKQLGHCEESGSSTISLNFVMEWLRWDAYNLTSTFSVQMQIGKMKVAQSCPTLCNPMDCSPPGSSVHGILQKRILEWVVVPFSRGSSKPRDRTQASCIVGKFFTVWATREALCYYNGCKKQQEIFMGIMHMSSPKMTGYLYI